MERQAAAKAQKTPARVNHQQTQSARSSSASHPLLELQRSIGNQAAQRLIDSSYIQTKLKVSTPGDPFEQEADRVADTVMRMPVTVATAKHPVIQTKSLASQITPLIHRAAQEPSEDEEVKVAAKPFVQRVPLAVREDDEDEEKIARESESNAVAGEEEKEKLVATKTVSDTPIQRQTRDDDNGEETPGVAPAIQRQMREEEEEIAPKLFHQVAANPTFPVARKHYPTITSFSVSSLPAAYLQRFCTECEVEQGKQDVTGVVQRQSAPNGDEDEPVMSKAERGQLQTSSALQQKLATSKGSGIALPDETRSHFESALGADFSGVQIHTGADAVEMNKDLGAHAFTHGSNIYFNAGRYDPSSSSGKRLLAHELTHTVQQGGSLRTKKQTEAGDQFSITEGPAIQATWYNFSIPFTDYEFDPSWEGVKTAAGVAADTAKEGAIWVKDRVVKGLEWIAERITDLVNDGIEWLTTKFDEIKEFASTCFDRIKNTVVTALTSITSPMNSITRAFSNLNADLLSTAWSALTAGAKTAWQIIKTGINGVLKIGSGIWSVVSKYVTWLFDTVGSLLDSTAFGLLPDIVKSPVRKLYRTLRSLWESIRDFWTDLWKRLTSFVQDLLTSIESFVQRVLAYAIDVVIKTVKKIKEIYDFVQLLVTDPEAVVRPLIDHIAGKIESESPGKAREFSQQKMAEALSSGSSSASPAVIIQRQPAGKPLRTTATRDEVNAALERTFAEQIAAALKNVRKMLWETFVNVVWPPATIREIAHQCYELVMTDWANALDSLFLPRNMFDDFGGFLHDVWTNILILLDFPLALLRRLINVLMLLMVYVTIILMIIGAVGGAIAGNVPGAIAGAVAGFKLAWAIGEALFVAFIIVEAASALKAFLDLFTARQTEKEKERDYIQIVGSSLGVGVAIVIALLFMILGSLASRIAAFIKSRKALPPPTPPKQLGAGEPPAQPPVEKPPTQPPVEKPPATEPPVEKPPAEPPVEKPPAEPPVEKPPTEPPVEKPPTEEPPVEKPPATEPPVEKPLAEPPVEKPPAEPPVEKPPTEEPPVEKPPKKKPPKEPKEPPGPKKDLKDLTIDELVKEGDKKPRPKETKQQAEERVRDAKAEAKRRGYCFVKGTFIQTPDGPRAIETLLAGQMVLAKGEDEPVQTYAINECLRSSTSILYHLEIGGTLKLSTTRHHPFFVPGKGWTKAKDLLAGDKLFSLDGEIVFVTNVVKERLLEPVTTFNFHISEAHSYFAGNGPAVLVHNGTPVNDPILNGDLLWGLGASGPRQRMPDPVKDFKGDLDGASAFRTNSTDEVGRMLGASATERTGNHGAITEAQLKSKGLVAVKTPGEGAIAEAGFEHVSIRPENNPDASKPLTEAEMAEVKAKLEELKPVASNKPADFLC